MTTDRSTKELKVCSACGWYEHTKFLNTQCNPALGGAASTLQNDVSEIRSTKIGYGDRQLTFEIDDHFCIGLSVRHPWNASGDARDESSVMFDWNYIHAMDGLSHDDAIDLIRVLHDWNTRRRARALVEEIRSVVQTPLQGTQGTT